jgi:hypothetical protein
MFRFPAYFAVKPHRELLSRYVHVIKVLARIPIAGEHTARRTCISKIFAILGLAELRFKNYSMLACRSEFILKEVLGMK